MLHKYVIHKQWWSIVFDYHDVLCKLQTHKGKGKGQTVCPLSIWLHRGNQ